MEKNNLLTSYGYCNKVPQTCGLDNINLFSYISRDQKCKITYSILVQSQSVSKASLPPKALAGGVSSLASFSFR